MPGTLVGISTDDLKLPTKKAVVWTAESRFQALEIGAVAGELAAWELSASGRRHLRRFVEGNGLQLASLSADLPLRWTDRGAAEERVARTLKVLDMAAEIDVPTVTTFAGAIINPETGDPDPTAVEALHHLGDFAERRGRTLCLRASYGGGAWLARTLAALDCPAIRVCLDPAAMVMAGGNPVAAFAEWAERIGVVHARDGTAGRPENPGSETRLGEGEVDLRGLAELLHDADYHGAYILRRHDSRTPREDLLEGRKTLAKLLEA